MAEKTIVVDIDIKAEDIRAASAAMAEAQKQSAAYTQALNDLKTQQKEANALYKIGAISADENAKRQSALKIQMTEVSKSLRDSNKEYANNKTVVDAAKGSNEQLRARLSLLTKQYNSLSESERENSSQGKELGATIKTITDKLKANEKAVGDNRRNVGNYEEAVKSVAGKINVMGVNLGNVISQLETFSDGVKQTITATKAQNASIGATVTGLGALKLALIATGLGAFLVVLGSVVSFLTKTKEGSEALARVMSQVGAAVSVVVDRFAKFGAALNQLRLGNFAKAADLAKESVSGIGEELANETREAKELTKRLQELTDAERKLSVERANSRATIKELNKDAEDTTKTLQEREAAAVKAIEIEKRLMDEQVRLAQERFDIIKAQNEQGESLAEDLDRQAEAEKALAAIRMESFEMQTTLQNKLNTIRQQDLAKYKAIEAEKRKLTEAQIKAEEEAEAKRAKIREDFRREQLSDIQKRKEDAFNKANELRAAGETEKSIQTYLSQELKEIHRDEQDAILNDRLKTLEDYATEAKLKAQISIQDEQVRAATILQIERDLAEAKQQELDLQIMQYQASTEALGVVDEERRAQLVQDKLEVDAQIVELDNKKTELLEQNAVKLADTRKSQEREALGAAQGGLGVISNIVDGLKQQAEDNISAIEAQAKAAGKTDAEINAMTKRAKKEAHELQVAAAIVQTLQAAISAYSSASATPIIGPYLGPIAAAAALAFGFANVSKMKQEKFADGGVAQGPSHAQGGIPFTVAGHGGYEMEGNEIILTKGVYQDPHLRQQASILNQLGGGKALVPGAYMASGGIASPTFAARSASSNQNAVLESQIAQLGDRIAEMQPVVRVSDINRINQQTVRVQQSADL
jgi:hypothetical protein